MYRDGSGSESLSVGSIPLFVLSAFFLAIYSAMILPSVKKLTPDYFQENARDFQLPLGPTLSQGTLEELHLVVLIYIPSIITFFCFLGPIIFYLRVHILTSTSMLPSVSRHHTGRFVGAIERCASLRPLPFPVIVLIQTSKSPKDVL